MIYFDHSATSLEKPKQVKENMIFALEHFGNPNRGIHAPSLMGNRQIFNTRKALAKLISAPSPDTIVFATSGTHALNLALLGLFSSGDHLMTGTWSHNSVLRPLYHLEKQGISLSIVSQVHHFSLEEIQKQITPKTKALILSHASNVTGAYCDLVEIGKFCHEKNLLFIVDAAQTIGLLPINVTEMHIDILCFSGHKSLYGPTGTGGLYVSPQLSLRPLLFGGSGNNSFSQEQPSSMPERLEAGTLNVTGISGLLGALEWIESIGQEAILAHQENLTQIFTEEVKKIPQITLYGRENYNLPVVALNIEGKDSSVLSDILWHKGALACRGGIHCAPLLHQDYMTETQGMLRFSFSFFNTEEEILQGISLLKDLASSFVL
ncbi:MAG: aminotransferase class V-fold PLP-dependent enzyme [Eubacteriales bacterium]